jgi:methionyl-tRNA synthetase
MGIFDRFRNKTARSSDSLSLSISKDSFSGVTIVPEKDLQSDSISQEVVAKGDTLLDTYKVSDALSAVLDLAKRCNKYIDETMPWALAKDEEKKARLGTVLYNLLEGIRFIAVLLKPFMPETSDKIL